MQVPLLDLQAQYDTIRGEIQQRVNAVFESQQFVLGREVEECEEAIAAYTGTSYAVGVSSGSDALLVSLMAEGISQGDEVITTPYSFFATAGAIARAGATPVFVDIDPLTYNMDPRKLEAEITPRTRAIMPVHLFGQLAAMDDIMDIAERNRLTVIEDAAQAIGAEDGGNRAGHIGHYGCFSFFPSKNLSGAGDGGMVVTNDEGRARKVRSLRVHGMTGHYQHEFIGANMRLDALQAAVVKTKLKHLDAWTQRRQENATRYTRWFAEKGLSPGADDLEVKDTEAKVRPPLVCTERHVFNQYVIRAEKRDALKEHLRDNGVGSAVYYPCSLHEQKCFQYLGYKTGDFPNSEQMSNETLALPVFPELTEDQARKVVDTIEDFYRC